MPRGSLSFSTPDETRSRWEQAAEVPRAGATLRAVAAAALSACGTALILTIVLGLFPLAGSAAAATGIQKIEHVVMIMQENRSFDTYFGTYPGANGIPKGVCVPDPANGGCVRPFHNPENKNFGGPHGTGSVIKDVNGGRMDGFVRVAEEGLECSGATDPACSPCNASESE